MKVILIILLLTTFGIAQKSETFDIVTYRTPVGWQKEVQPNAVQIGTSDSQGSICLITLFKPMVGTNDSKFNFNSSWDTLVKGAVTVNGKLQMSPPVTENGWTAESGLAAYESDGKKGVVMLVTISGDQKMVNILVLTNSADFQQDVSDFLASIDLPKVGSGVPPAAVQTSTAIPVATRKSNYKFNTTNFDDGWTSTEQEDWVEVVKGPIKVLIHYPKEGAIFPADPAPLINAAWDILVAPRYANLKNYRTTYITTYDRPYLGMGYATDRASGKQVFLVLFRRGASGWIEFIAPDKNTFVQQFRFDPEAVKWDSDSDVVNPLAAMVNYNKFAIGEGDFSGSWTSDFDGVQQLYHVYTGNYAGMNINQSREEFNFGPSNTYNWKLLVVNGMVGNMKYANVASAGRFSVLNNWQIQFSKIESGPKIYSAYWSCIKGARLLHLLNAKSPGIGIYTIFGKK